MPQERHESDQWSSNSYVQSIMGSALESAGLSPNSATSTFSTTTQTDGQQLSPFAQMLSALQQLQQSDPAKYAQVTQQISTNLQAAAQTAQSQGNTAAANQLNQLATDFGNASKSGHMPNIQDLAQAIGAHHHHHHGHHGSGESAGSSQGEASSQLISLNPMSIIDSTLASAGVYNEAAEEIGAGSAQQIGGAA
jgi:hypothetical protein